MSTAGQQLLPTGLYELPILDVWTRHTDVIGSELRSSDRQAEVVMVRLSQEFMATDNIRVLGQIESVLEATRAESGDFPDGLVMGLTGSAAVGGDMLRSAAESIKNTELYTILMVVLILIVVYRSPLLVLVPLMTIGVSVVVSTGLVAALTQVHQLPGFEWWNFRIFTTTKIFVVVILFGAGTDFCLFLISRYREELDAGRDKATAVSTALAGVGEALAASAMTTIIGLATMFFAEFGKFRNSGPAIGLCLTVTLLACLTLAPALLRGLGPAVFWRLGPASARRTPGQRVAPQGLVARFWEWLSQLIVAYPGRVLVLSTAPMLPLALLGTQVTVTYDFLSELDEARPSKRGTQLMRQHFPIGETGPLTILARTQAGDLDSPAGKIALKQLTQDLYLDGVREVRSLAEPRRNPQRLLAQESRTAGPRTDPLPLPQQTAATRRRCGPLRTDPGLRPVFARCHGRRQTIGGATAGRVAKSKLVLACRRVRFCRHDGSNLRSARRDPSRQPADPGARRAGCPVGPAGCPAPSAGMPVPDSVGAVQLLRDDGGYPVVLSLDLWRVV